jgi:hypothetical protein
MEGQGEVAELRFGDSNLNDFIYANNQRGLSQSGLNYDHWKRLPPPASGAWLRDLNSLRHITIPMSTIFREAVCHDRVESKSILDWKATARDG